MTCTTCHEPHTSVAAQGTARFDAVCVGCHAVGRKHTSLPVRAVTGAEARTPGGCVDCHVRRSQPFDLPRVRSADHFIQRRIAAPRDDLPHRSFADQAGDLVVFDDGRLAAALQSPAGQRWRSGVLAMGLVTLGRFPEAARLFDAFPAPGSAAARQPAAPPGLAPLETHPAFHSVRALVLMASGRADQAEVAFTDALALDARDPDALLGRARLRLDRGDIAGALLDSQAVIEAHPDAEHPWDLRVEIAQRAGRPDLAVAALRASTRRWPSNAAAWLRLALLLRQQGDADGADEALRRARTLRPSLVPPPR